MQPELWHSIRPENSLVHCLENKFGGRSLQYLRRRLLPFEIPERAQMSMNNRKGVRIYLLGPEVYGAEGRMIKIRSLEGLCPQSCREPRSGNQAVMISYKVKDIKRCRTHV